MPLRGGSLFSWLVTRGGRYILSERYLPSGLSEQPGHLFYALVLENKPYPTNNWLTRNR